MEVYNKPYKIWKSQIITWLLIVKHSYIGRFVNKDIAIKIAKLVKIDFTIDFGHNIKFEKFKIFLNCNCYQ